MTLQDIAAWLLDTIPVDVYDGRPQVTPPGNYAYLTMEGGVTSRTNIGRTDRLTHTAHIVCVGVDPTGARIVAGKVRMALLDARPDRNHILTELPAGPMLIDGTPTTGGERTSITLTYQLRSTT